MGQRDGLGNQQERAEADLQWLGGVFDGEGSFSLVFNGRTETATAMVRFTNTSDVMIAEVLRIIDAHGLPRHVQQLNPTTGTKPIWHISINGAKRSRRFLEVVMPYLRAKRKEAAIVWDFVQSRLARLPGAQYSAEEVNWFLELRELHGYRLQQSSETIRLALAKARR